ncbi:hypothetical protein [Tritonibacter mobilis]|uniref:hypothetical protein n=1 Tax=Tritonibacter mobilis TaxID=379347 RepID=UPI000806BF1F|nr:hypothetical protein [Tritonibacter mobilis]GLP86265.1 hypothetical protein GCM10007921_18250 [Tritonibacter mobilis]SDX17519.1 hypothetical protein SAMN05444385_105196 [Tritonibacter mobilis]
MQEIDLIPGAEIGNKTAFCPEKMDAAGVDAVSLSKALTERLAPFAALLTDGRGVGLFVRGEDASVVGILTDD